MSEKKGPSLSRQLLLQQQQVQQLTLNGIEVKPTRRATTVNRAPIVESFSASLPEDNDSTFPGLTFDDEEESDDSDSDSGSESDNGKSENESEDENEGENEGLDDDDDDDNDEDEEFELSSVNVQNVKRETKQQKTKNKTNNKNRKATKAKVVVMRSSVSTMGNDHWTAKQEIPTYEDYAGKECDVFRGIHFLLSGFDDEERLEIETKVLKGNGRVIQYCDLLNTGEHVISASKYVLICGNSERLETRQQDPTNLHSYPLEVLVALALDIKILKRQWIDECYALKTTRNERTNPNLPQFFVEKVGVITVNNMMHQVLRETDTKKTYDLKPNIRNRVFQGGVLSFYISAKSKEFTEFYSKFIVLAGAKIVKSISSITYDTMVLSDSEDSLSSQLLQLINSKELRVVNQYYIYACVLHRRVHSFTEEFLLLRSQREKAQREKMEQQRRKEMMLKKAAAEAKRNLSVPDLNELTAKVMNTPAKTPSRSKSKTPTPPRVTKKVALVPNQGLYIKMDEDMERYMVNDCVELENPAGTVAMITSFFEEEDMKRNRKIKKFTARLFKRYEQLSQSIKDSIVASEPNEKKRKLKETSLYFTEETYTGPATNIKGHFLVMKNTDKISIYCTKEECEIGITDIGQPRWNDPLHPYREYVHDTGHKVPRFIPTPPNIPQKKKMLFILFGDSKVKTRDHIVRESYESCKLLEGSWCRGQFVRLTCKVPPGQNKDEKPKQMMLEVFGQLRKFIKETNKQKQQHTYHLTLTRFSRASSDERCLQKGAKETIRIDSIREMEEVFIVGKQQIPPNATNNFFYL